jgi:lyso-ornithine lipid O-acyltransferase
MSRILAVQRRKIRRGSAVLAATLRGLWLHRELPPDASRSECARWLHESCARAMRVIDLQVEISGALPQHGMIVSNHVSYLDIPALSTALPCVFVSKAEVEQWPLIGRYARWAGSVFVHRHDRADAARANISVADALHNGVPVVLFPEGTTTDGRRVLRFHSTMLQPAIDAAAPVTPCAIHYELEDGDPALEVCWWGSMTLLPHVWNLLGKKIIRVRIAFGETMPAAGDRKQLGARLHDSVLCLYHGLVSGGPARCGTQG